MPVIELLYYLLKYAALLQLLCQLLERVLEEVTVLLQLKLADLRLLKLVVESIICTSFVL